MERTSNKLPVATNDNAAQPLRFVCSPSKPADRRALARACASTPVVAASPAPRAGVGTIYT
eukprot:4947838-Pleurochrysis_carterae.AAC.1